MIRARPRTPTNAVALVVLAGLTACASPASPTSRPSGGVAVPSTTTSGASATPPPTPEPTRPPSPSPVVTPGAEPPPIGLQLVASGLASPISVAPAEAGRLYVNEQGGRVAAVDPDGTRRTVLDIAARISSGGERGLLGLALHPRWPEVGRAFVHYTDPNGDTVLSEMTAAGSADAPTIDAATERAMLRVDQPYPNHNGGELVFGPDGNLYLGLGDGGAGGDPFGNGQNSGVLLGKILRLDVDAEQPYAIPPDNPFASGGGAPEVYAYGLRNPWRFSFDRAAGDLWIADVGQGAYEEVDRLTPSVAPGANLGWDRLEGAHCFSEASCSTAGTILPVAEYGRDLGSTIIGGYVYRGSAIPALVGWYVYADYGSGRIFASPSTADPAAGPAAPIVLLETDLHPTAFGQGADGELYIVETAGGLYRIVDGE